MRKKHYALILALMLFVVILTGCTQSNEEDISQTDKITIMSSQDWIKDSELKLGEKFEEETGIKVEYQIINANEYQSELLSRLKSDDKPDIFMAQSGFALSTTYMVQDNAVELTNEPWMESYSAFSVDQTSVAGSNYGMTYYDTTTDYCFVYNKKILAEAGITEIPKTYDEFADMCQKILDYGVVPIYEPVADGWHQTMLWAECGQVFDKLEPGLIDKLNANETTFADNNNMKKALEQINNLAQKGYFGENYFSDEFVYAHEKLASGEYAMCFLKPGDISSIVENKANENGYTEDDFGLMLFPLCDNQYLNVHPTGPSKFISVGSSNIGAAKKYFSFIATKENVQYMIDNESSCDNLPFYLGQTPSYSKATKEFLDSFDEKNSGMVLQDVVKYYNEQWGDISQNMAAMFRGEMSEEEVLIAVDEERARLAKAAGNTSW